MFRRRRRSLDRRSGFLQFAVLRAVTVVALTLLIVRAVWIANAPVSNSKTGPVTIELVVWGIPFELALYKNEYVPEFERQNPDIKVKLLNFENYESRILLSYAGGMMPDVAREHFDIGINWIHRGMNLPLDRFIDGPDGIDRSDFLPQTWAGLKYRGKTYGVPQDLNMLGLFYNKDLFDQAHLKYPDSTWTWADLKRASDQLTTLGPDGHPIKMGLDLAWGANTFRPFLLEAGGKFWEADGVTPAFDSPEAVRALTFYKSLLKSYSLTQSGATNSGGLGPDKFFESGRIALYIDGSWRSPSLKKDAPGLRFGVAPLPRGDIPMSSSVSCYWAVSSQTKHPDEAWRLAKYLSSKQALTRYWQVLWVAPPARWSVINSPEYKEVTGAGKDNPGIDSPAEFHEKCDWIAQVLRNNWTTTEPCGPFTSIAMAHLGKAVDQVLLENRDPAAALHEAARLATDDIKEAQKGFP